MSRIEGQLALITGASAGIGAATARRLARDGAHLVLWARREDRLRALAEEIGAAHDVDVERARVDVRDREAVAEAARRLVAAGRTPDILINNAGLASGLAPLQEGDLEDWDRMIDTNVKGLLFVTRAILPAMIERGSGHVVHLGSIAGFEVYPNGNVYNATKYAVRAIQDAMNIDLLGTPIRVSSVEPGAVETEFSLVRLGDPERAKAVYRGYTPLSGDDVAEAIAFIVNAPPNVNVTHLGLFATAQRSANHFYRTPDSSPDGD